MAQDAGEEVRATEVIAAVSLAVDIGMAQPPETGLAVCLVAVELAERERNPSRLLRSDDYPVCIAFRGDSPV